MLYKDHPAPNYPVTDLNPPKSQRNEEIRHRYAAGETVPDLAREYGISEQRIHQILQGKRK
ncbi:MAG: Hin recombinase [Anaerolineae bacterium]|nr:Hin recombinase [Anaerolineae bacterium]